MTNETSTEGSSAAVTERPGPTGAPPQAPRFRQQARDARGASRESGAVVGLESLRQAASGPHPPVWQRLRDLFGAVGRRRVPVRLQSQMSDCGAACLSMTLALHDIEVPVTELRAATGTGRDGASARLLLDAARSYGFQSRGVRVSLKGLRSLPPGTILFWNFNHFVVLEHVVGDRVHLVDPSHGRRRMSLSAVGDSFTGVALVIRPGPEVPARTGRGRRGGDSPWQYLRMFLQPSRRWVWFTLCSLLLLLLNLAVPLATSYVGNMVTGGRSALSPGYLAIGLIVLLLALMTFQFARAMYFNLIQASVDETVTLGILDRLLDQSYAFFSSRRAGDLLQRVRTSSQVRQVLSASAFTSLLDGLLILLYMGLLLFADQLLAGVVIVLALLQVGVLMLSWRPQEYAGADALEARSLAESELAELIEGMPTLKSAAAENDVARRWSNTLAEELNSRLRARRLQAVSSAVSSGLQTGAPLVVLAVGALRVADGALTLGKVLGFSVLAMGMLVPLTNLVQVGLQISGLRADLARLDDIMRSAPQPRGERYVPPAATAYQAEEASFGYESGPKVLHGVSFSVPPGSFTVLLGASGSGKSTCALLLAGLHTPVSGRVLVDGQDLAGLDTVGYRRSVSFVNQEARLFSGSIRDNLTWHTDRASDADIEEAARTAGIHDTVAALPMGYDTMLGPGGAGLSGGQRQRVVLARALLRKPSALVLDEATSALDPVMEQQILTRLRQLDTTLVVVAHRLTAIEEADQIVVLDGGRVVQQGRHDELITQKGLYRALVR
ncbi:peptidase domain-containing ABC transporter [Streptomyces sp. GbtcB6]|uniref:peptidase domain-containing ABC transporter n=1 Tax=Streptomyces sp. GbtcB6 TaxID=2824751 RepID=UPI001C310EBF|nr:peptidase domain-containing ABC transporter [Streptomyces sp. GbtcB6]